MAEEAQSNQGQRSNHGFSEKLHDIVEEQAKHLLKHQFTRKFC